MINDDKWQMKNGKLDLLTRTSFLSPLAAGSPAAPDQAAGALVQRLSLARCFVRIWDRLCIGTLRYRRDYTPR
jgi:hypothetical protein